MGVEYKSLYFQLLRWGTFVSYDTVTSFRVPFRIGTSLSPNQESDHAWIRSVQQNDGKYPKVHDVHYVICGLHFCQSKDTFWNAKDNAEIGTTCFPSLNQVASYYQNEGLMLTAMHRHCCCGTCVNTWNKETTFKTTRKLKRITGEISLFSQNLQHSRIEIRVCTYLDFLHTLIKNQMSMISQHSNYSRLIKTSL